MGLFGFQPGVTVARRSQLVCRRRPRLTLCLIDGDGPVRLMLERYEYLDWDRWFIRGEVLRCGWVNDGMDDGWVGVPRLGAPCVKAVL
jgi:hypothetical protein